jgi:hypothetical protein
MLIHIEGGCPGFPLQKSRRDTIHLSSTNATLRNPQGDGSLTYVFVDLGELEDGHYDLDISVDGTVDNLTVIDSYGEIYAKLVPPFTALFVCHANIGPALNLQYSQLVFLLTSTVAAIIFH